MPFFVWFSSIGEDESRREALVKFDDVGGVGADQCFGLIRADTVANQPDLVRFVDVTPLFGRSEERRVGKECRL